MATQTIPTVANGGSTLDNLIASLIKSTGGSGTSTSTTSSGYSDQLSSLLNNLVNGTGEFSKTAAIADSTGAMQNLAQQTLQQYIPSSAAQVRGSGLYNSSTKALLDNDATAKLSAAMAALVQKNVTDYATISQNSVNSAANAAKTSTTTTQKTGGSTSDALKTAGLGLLASEGKKLASSLFDAPKTAGALTDSFGSDMSAADALSAFGGPVVSSVGTNAVAGSSDVLGDFIGNITGSSSGAASGSSDVLGDFITSLGSGALDAGSTIANGAGAIADIGTSVIDGIGSAVDSVGSTVSDIGSSIADWFSGFFSEGGIVPVKEAPKSGKIGGPKSPTGKDNQLIAVQGGEGILHTGVMEQPGMNDLVEALNSAYARGGK